MNPRVRRAGLAAALIVLSAVGISSPAWAGASAQRTSGSQKLTSGSWGAAGTSSGDSPTTGSAFTLTWQGIGGSTTQYFEIDNTGTFDLSGETYTTTNSPLKLIGTTAPTVTLTGCVNGSWNTRNNSCSGQTVTLDTSAAGSTTHSPSTPSTTAGDPAGSTYHGSPAENAGTRGREMPSERIRSRARSRRASSRGTGSTDG